MVIFGGLLDLGIAVLLAVALAEYFKWRNKADKGFAWLAVGGVLLVFAGLTQVGGAALVSYGFPTDAVVLIFQVIGWLFALIGTVFIAYETLMGK